MNERDPFVEDNWPTMQEKMESAGPGATAAFIDSFEDPAQRRKLYFFGHRAFGGRDWAGKDLDKTAQFTELAIEEMLRQSEAEPDPKRSGEIKDLGNVMSFNLSADLADCWPGDEVPRTEAQFRKGLDAAENCIRWRTELQKGPSPFSMAWWVKGMHLLSLARPEEAQQSFARSLEFAIEAARESNHGTEIDELGHWSVLLGEGYVRIAGSATGETNSRESLQRCHEALEKALTAQPEQEGDLQFCIDQLRKVEDRYLP